MDARRGAGRVRKSVIKSMRRTDVVEDNTDSRTGDLKKADLTRQRILEGAAHAFLEKGYAATRLSDIAAAARMQAGSIYYHFDSKEQIMVAVLDIGTRGVLDAVREAVEALGPQVSWRERIRIAIHAHLRQMMRRGDFTAADIRNYGHLPRNLRDRQAQARTEYGEFWRELIEGASAAGELRKDVNLSLARMFVLGTLNWTIEWYKPGKLPTDAIAEEFWRMLFGGLAPPDQGTDTIWTPPPA